MSLEVFNKFIFLFRGHLFFNVDLFLIVLPLLKTEDLKICLFSGSVYRHTNFISDVSNGT